MAIRTRTPSRGWSSVTPYSNYSSVVSNYASAVSTAQQEEKNTELEGKILSYKNGNITYNELSSYIQSRLASETPGTAKELALRETLSSAEEYERDQQVKINRAKMMEQYSKGGISADEQVRIEQNLLQYYKPGSASYAQQLAVISTAKETARVENNNAKVAKLQGELSSGGLTKNEQVRVLEEMKRYAEPGSQDALAIDSKIAITREEAKQETQQEAVNAKTIELYDRYGSGGLTNEEQLQMIKELEPLVDRNSPDYLELKKKEMALMEAVSKSGTSAGNKEIDRRISEANLLLQDTKYRYANGLINTEEYLKSKQEILNKITPEELAQQPLNEDIFALQNEINNFQKQKSEVEAGQSVQSAQTGELVSLKDLAKSAYSQQATVYADENSSKNGDTTKMVPATVVEVFDDKGNKRFISVSDGKLEELSPVAGKEGEYFKTNRTITPQELTIPSLAPKKEVAPVGIVPTVSPSLFSPSNVSNMVSNLKAPVESVASTAKKATKKVMPIMETATKTAVGSTLGSLFGPVGSTAGSIVSSAKPTTGKINIGNVNVPDYGVTEKVGGLFNQAKNTVSSFIGSIFGKR